MKNFVFCIFVFIFDEIIVSQKTVSMVAHHFFTFYRDGLKNMTVGKTLWVLVLVKLFIMFGILRVFFFPDLLNTNFDNDESRADYVQQELLNIGNL
jgi:hypothetical protein